MGLGFRASRNPRAQPWRLVVRVSRSLGDRGVSGFKGFRDLGVLDPRASGSGLRV